MADDEAVQNDRRRRKLTFAEEVETVSLPTDSDSNRTNPKSTYSPEGSASVGQVEEVDSWHLVRSKILC